MNSLLRAVFAVCLTLAGGPTIIPQASAQEAGTLDTSFHPPQLHIVFDVAARPDGRVVVGGGTYNLFAPPVTFAQLLENGAPDPSFNTGTGPDGAVLALELLPDGRIVIGGAFTNYDGVTRAGLARVNTNGSLDATFPDVGFNGQVDRIARQPDGKLIVTGGFTSVGGVPRAGIARLNADSSLDESFDAGPTFVSGNVYTSPFYAVAVQPNGQIVVGGTFGDGSPGSPLNLARLHPNGALDTSFMPPELLLPVFSLALLPDGKILVGGEFWEPAVNLIRVHTNGAWDETFSANIGPVHADPIVDALLVQPDGRILIGGRNFREAGGLERHRIARLHADGAVDEAFAPVSGPSFNAVYALALQPDGKILAGGSFLQYDGVPTPGLARLHNDGFEERVQFVAASYYATEEEGRALISVRRVGLGQKRVHVGYRTLAGTAQPGQDYRPVVGRLVFEPGETVKTFTVVLRRDQMEEGAETVSLRLRHAFPRRVQIGMPGSAVLTIND
jgi:uncharacterized delta-60 repeat protein